MEHTTFYEKMHDESIMLTFKGEATSDLINALLASVEPKINSWETDLRTRKRLFSILVECLQNLIHHGDSVDEVVPIGGSGKITLMMLTSEDDSYCIHTGNSIRNKKIKGLRDWLDVVNLLTPDELRINYKKILDEGELSQKGTAGLGFIDIARKSGQRLEYEFQQVNDDYSIFSFSIKIPKKPILTNAL